MLLLSTHQDNEIKQPHTASENPTTEVNQNITQSESPIPRKKMKHEQGPFDFMSTTEKGSNGQHKGNHG